MRFQNFYTLYASLTRELQVQSLTTWISLESFLINLSKLCGIKVPFTITVFEILMFKGGSVLPPTQQATVGEKDHWFSTKENFFEKLTFLTPSYAQQTCAYQGIKDISFLENFAYILNEWSQRVNNVLRKIFVFR